VQIQKLSTKLLVAFLTVGLIPFTVIGTIALINSQNALTSHTMSHLESVRDAKKLYVQQFFETQLGNVRTLAEVGSVVTATETMEEVFHVLGSNIENNPIWEALHERYTPAMKNYIDTHGYRDLYLIAVDGDVVFSVAEKSDLGRNVLDGSLRKSPLGKCFINTLKKGMALTDFELYEPHNNDPALFAGAVVKRGDFISGVVVLNIPIEMINRIMLERSGLGQTGETYLVGSDRLMRSDSYQDPEGHSVKSSLAEPERSKLDTEAVHLALAGKTGAKIVDDYRGVQVVSAFTPLRFGDMTWALIAEIDKSEAFASVRTLRFLIGLVAFIGIMVVVSVSFFVTRRISNPLGKLTRATEEISQGRFEVIPDTTLMVSKDEIGLLAKSFNAMTDQLKRSMGDLKESEEKFRSFIEDAPVAMYTIDIGGTFTYANKKLLGITGYELEDWLNKPFHPIVHPDDLETVIHNRQERIAGKGRVDPYEIRIFNAAKEIMWVKLNSESIYETDTQGEKTFAGMQTFVEDVTDRKQAEEALRESEKKYRNVLETSLDPIIVYDMEGRVIYFNQAFTRVFGWTLTERMGKKMDLFVPVYAWPETQIMIDKVKAGENFSSFETRRLTKDGRVIHVTMSLAVNKDKSGKPIGSVVNLKDVSEQKRLEARLQRAHKMEALGLLAGGVAHDLNNVLSGIVSYPDLLLMQIPEDSPLRKPILIIQKSGKKAADIVQDLLTMARRGVVVENVVSLNGIIAEYLKNPEYEKLRSFHPKVEVETALAPDLFNISGSDVHLSKTVMNLVSNAAEAMPDGGRISITTENCYVDSPISGYDSFQEGDYVTLTVSDDGIGIDPEDKERIFEPFYTKKVMGRSGTGLGMAVVWGTVKDHNGYIDLQSREGKGTAFRLYFPATRMEESKEKIQLPVESYMGKGESILVVDDLKEQRELVDNLLTPLGYVVAAVPSGEDAVVYMKDHSVDLLIIDMIMDAGMDGQDTYRRIVEIRPGQKAIIASGFSESRRVKAAQKLGAGAYVKKPYTMEKLGMAVRNELDKFSCPDTHNEA